MSDGPRDLPRGWPNAPGDGGAIDWDDYGIAAAPLPTPEEKPPHRGWLRRHWRWRYLKWAIYTAFVLLVLLIGWLTLFVPVSRTAQPLVPPQIVLETQGGQAIARKGPTMAEPVEIADLPPHVVNAFLAVEDRRFYDHWGIDPHGIARALWSNLRSDTQQGGSTITQQLAKLSYLKLDRTVGRKLKEVPIALWLEAWLSKDEILERYLSNAYFGDNVYGLRAASMHYFYRQPERLTLTQGAMLAGLVKAPSTLAPTRNYKGAVAREKVVLSAMAGAGYMTPDTARAVKPATIDHRPGSSMPAGSYFADWALGQARAVTEDAGYKTVHIRTTQDGRLQRLAERIARRSAPAGAEVAIVAMRPNGQVVAMVGGKDYGRSKFNRAVQARRQPGSTFKLIVYLAALQSGMTPDTLVEDSPITTGDYRPENAGKHYRGRITLRDAFAVSSNVVAVKLYQQLGSATIGRAARSLGINETLPANASVALGSAGISLLNLTSAFAGIASDYAPVEPHAIAQGEKGFFGRLLDGREDIGGRVRAQMRDLLAANTQSGTGRAARLAIPAFGKTGTSQDSRDALFVGFAGDLVVGIWIGRDDNSSLGRASGGGIPARMWKDFMIGAIPGAAPRAAPEPKPELEPALIPDGSIPVPNVQFDPDEGLVIDGNVGGNGVRIDRGGIRIDPDDETQRRLDQLDRRREQLERAVEAAQHQAETQARGDEQAADPPR
ncbi:transglycosylase domain-containing protein [Novosphingopyxis sp.]|uniref:transglycosylase domain-containing protein n=1 Tax=Novosphingopyxis sp. TaxID=2709690 RepID=UPI003B5CCBCB